MSTLPAGFRLRSTPLVLGELWRAAGRGGSTGREDIAHACCDKELWLSRRSVAATKACATLQADLEYSYTTWNFKVVRKEKEERETSNLNPVGLAATARLQQRGEYHTNSAIR